VICIKDSYKSVIDSSAIVSKTDADGVIIYVNDKFCEFSGYDESELVGAKQSIIKHEDTQTSIYKELWQTISSGNIWHGTLKNRRKNASYYYIRTTIYPILDENDSIIEYMSVAYPVTREVLKEKSKNKKIIDTKTNLVERTRSQTAELEAEIFELNIKLRKATNIIDTLSKNQTTKVSSVESKLDQAYQEIDSLKKEIRLKDREASMSQLNFTRKEKELNIKLNSIKTENMDLKSRNDNLNQEKKKLQDTITSIKNSQKSRPLAKDKPTSNPTYKDEEKQRKLAIKGLFG
jgi:PAS domain S-box-containing protein